MSEAKKEVRKIKLDRIITAVLAIIIGVLFIVFNNESANVLCIVSGVILVLFGVVTAVSSFSNGAMLGRYSLMLGIALALAGFLCILRPSMVIGILSAIFGIIIAVDGAITFIDAVDCARAKMKEWFILMLISFASMALGIVIMFVESTAIMVLAGVFLIIEGVIDIVIICLFGKRIKEAKRIIARAVRVEDADEYAEATEEAVAEAAPVKSDEDIAKEIGDLGRE